MSDAGGNVKKHDIQLCGISNEWRAPSQVTLRLRQISLNLWKGKFRASEWVLTIGPKVDK